jgi:flagellin
MALSVSTNTMSLFAQRQLDKNSAPLARSLQRLSSGLRINSAADDAAGLSIAGRLTSQVRGLNVAARNANDGISMMQTAEGALTEISENIQRVRELSIQSANGSNGQGERNAMQAEVSQLLQEIDRISKTTSFGGKKLFEGTLTGPDEVDQSILTGMQAYWLRESQQRISSAYGLDVAAGGTGFDIQIVDSIGGGTLAFVQSAYSSAAPNATLVSQQMVLSRADFAPANLPNGGTGPQYNDRTIAHEMTHAIMARKMNINSIGSVEGATWFIEGTAEFIAGGEERLQGELYAQTAAAGSYQLADATALVGLLDNAWGQTSAEYAAGYAAVRYIDYTIKNTYGNSNGIKALFDQLEAGNTLSASLSTVSSGGWANVGAFETAFAASGGVGEVFVDTLFEGGGSGWFASADKTGAAGGSDALGIAGSNDQTAENVFPNFISVADQPLTNISTTFFAPRVVVGDNIVNYQVGAQANETIGVSFGSVDTVSLGIASVNISTEDGAQTALLYLDQALNDIARVRGDYGAGMNRLESTINNLQNVSENIAASRSRIVDADYAVESASLIKRQIIQQAATSVLSQANSAPRDVLNLLSALG